MKRKIKKILLIAPPITRPEDFSDKVVRVSPFFPLGIAYIAAYLLQSGKYEVYVLDALIDVGLKECTPLDEGKSLRYGMTDNEIKEHIKKVNPDVVGASCLFSAMEMDAANICAIAKEVNSDIVTLVGGTHAGSMAVEMMKRYDAIDYVIEGEAEVTFTEILDAIAGKKSFSALDGVALRKEEEVKYLPKTKYIEDLDALPFPARHLFPMEKYFKYAAPHSTFKAPPYTQMITSRGCPCKCTFCALGNHWGSRQRMRSSTNVLAEIENLVKVFGVKEIHFEDDNFCSNKKRALEILDGIIGMNLKISWNVPSGIAVYTLDDMLIAKMKESGCYSISLAIESGNQRVLTELMNKPVNLKLVPPLVDKIRKAGIMVRGFFIIGYPDETKENMRETVEYAKKLELDWAYFSIATPIPKTAMYDLCIKKGYIKEEDYDPLRSFHKCIIHTDEFTPEFLMGFREEAIIDVNFRNNANLRKHDIDKAITSFEEVVSRYPHFDFANFYLGEAYLKKGMRSKAIDSYRKTLVANPSHKEAKQRLCELDAIK